MSGDSHEPRTPGHVPLPPAFTQPAPRRVPLREGEQRPLPPFFGRASAAPAPAAPAAEELAPEAAAVAEPVPAPPLDEDRPLEVVEAPGKGEDTTVVDASTAPAPAIAVLDEQLAGGFGASMPEWVIAETAEPEGPPPEVHQSAAVEVAAEVSGMEPPATEVLLVDVGAAVPEPEAVSAVEEGDVAAGEPLAVGAPEPESVPTVEDGAVAVMEPLHIGAAPEAEAVLAVEEGGAAVMEPLTFGGGTVAELPSEEAITSEFGEAPAAPEAEPAAPEPEPAGAPAAKAWHMAVPEAAWEPTSELAGPWEPPADLLSPQAPAEEAAPASWEPPADLPAPQAPAEEAAPASWEPPADLLAPQAPAEEAAPASWEPPEPVVAESQEHAPATALPTPTVEEALEVAAARLEALAADLRHRGRAALDEGFSGDTLQAALCALIAGYLARRDH